MPKKLSPKSTPAAETIRRAAKASRSMSVRERLQLLLRAGLVTREQAQRATSVEITERPE